MELLIPCAFGLEKTVKRQIIALGYGNCPAQNGRILVKDADLCDVARLNVFLRSGERVLLKLGEFRAETFDELYDGVFSLPFEEYLTRHSKILMDGKCYKSTLMAVKACGGVAKKAIVSRLRDKLRASSFDERGERVIVGVSVFENVVTVTLDTSGEGLHKRGYRILPYEAPLKETVASSMVESSVYRAGKPFADLFCGSGTIPIEAALYALNLAPGRHRAFDFTAWKNTPKDILNRAFEEADDVRVRTKTGLGLIGSDISPKAIETAKFHAKRAGVEEHITFTCADMRTFRSQEKYGVMISNPPYGERLEKGTDLFALYRDFAKAFRALGDWSCYFLSGFSGAERAFGRQADKRKKLFNANLECGFYGYLGAKPPKGYENPSKNEN